MQILMLGWEYPPHISGGLGTACEGLTKALAAQGVELDFVVPRLRGGEDASHMTLVGAGEGVIIAGSRARDRKECDGLYRVEIPSFLQPYLRPQTHSISSILGKQPQDNAAASIHYGDDLFAEVQRYTESVISSTAGRSYDLIHAHDWMTYSAGIAVAERIGKPLVVHVHSLEYDRSGASEHPRICAIEQQGIRLAEKVIAVSHYTKSLISTRYSISEDKVEVVHNGVQARQSVPYERKSETETEIDERIVLFMGRITFQKGPEYFVEAAQKVIDYLPEVSFVMAGDGDQLSRMKELVADYGIEKSFEFPGFLRGSKLEEMYARAAVYVMPSVSEPFGIAPLEAIRADTPVIISRQSGVSEVIRHALKVDFWDTDRLAAHIMSALAYPELREDMVEMAREEVKRLCWSSAAEKLVNVYRTVV